MYQNKEIFSKVKSYFKKNKIGILFFLFLIFSIVLNILWIIKDKYPPRGNGIDFIREAIKLYNSNNRIDTLKQFFFRPYADFPLFSTLIQFIFYLFFGLKTKNELIINSLFLMILLVFTYKIGDRKSVV
jgi:hypothetical protein